MACGAGILGGMQDPANIQAWHRAMALAVRIHRITRNIRRAEAPGLALQLRRAVGSIPTNIAEGVGQPSAADCARFLSYAISSAFEVESHLVLADKLGLRLPGIGDAIDETRQVRRMTYGLRQHFVRKAATEKAAAKTKEADRQSDLPPPP
jgi:four helix bundle protein